MPWFTIDDGFADHPKVIRCSLAAIGLWSKAGSWCAKHLTDGAVPATMVKVWRGNAKLADELVDAGLWLKVDDGYQFHDWSHRNPTSSDVKAKRAADADRKRLEREESKRNPKGRPAGQASDVRADSGATPKGLQAESAWNPGARAYAGAGALPSQPLPSPAAALPPEARDSSEPDPESDPELRGRDVAVAWEAVSHQGLAVDPKALASFVHIADTFNRLEPEHARLACWVYVHWLFRAPDGPVVSGRLKRCRPWVVQAGVAEDLPLARTWFNALSEAEQAAVKPPALHVKHPEAAQ